MTFQLRLATPHDAAPMAEIYNHAIETTTATFDTAPQTRRERLRWMQSHDQRHPIYVAVDEHERVAGWGALSAWSERNAYRETAETSFYVAPEFQGRGIGRALKVKLIEEARRLGFHTLLARVADGSDASMHLNISLGFRTIGVMREVGYKFGRRIDVHILQLMLNPDIAPSNPKVANDE